MVANTNKTLRVLDSDGNVCATVKNGCLILRNRRDKDRYTPYNLLMVWEWLQTTMPDKIIVNDVDKVV